ncbi:hypothetical protein LCGC14_1408370 [marine sediment metagenome]|uniref:Uncharacterized protein n=1 Tax=marine sediment metagenome TaxID=412755 RepID=A0A0F9JVB1_9ZZZZ
MRKLLRWIVRALHIKPGKVARSHQITWAKFKEKVGDPIDDGPKKRGLKDGYYEGPLDLFGEIT